MIKQINFLVILLVLGLSLTPVHAGTETGPTGIHKAAFEGDLAKVKTFLVKDVKLANDNGLHGKKPLHWAAHGGHLAVAELLIANGAVIDSKNDENETPLHYAVAHGHLDIVKLFVSKGGGIDTKSNYGTLVSYAASWDHPNILKFLIEKGADVKAVDENGFTVLHQCAWRGSKEMIELLISLGIPADVKSDLGRTPLHNTAWGGNLEAAKVLIAKGADVNHRDEADMSPLYIATVRGYKSFVSLLLESGASVNIIQKMSQKALLHHAAISGYGEIAAMLLEKGADPNVKDIKGYTPLYYASRYGNEKVAKILISKGAVWTKNIKKEKMNQNFGFSPLLKKDFEPGSALIYYLGHSGWAIKTNNHLLVFDYSKRNVLPDTLLLANGTINPEEIKDLKTTVFVSHSHGDHYMPSIFDWKKEVKDITYVMGFKPEKQSRYIFLGPRETKSINGMEITTIESNDSGVGFFIKVDGVTIFHSGDHANRKRDFSGPFKREIDFLAEKGIKPEIFFAPVSGCGFGDLEAVKMGVFYTIKKLSPRLMVPMHAGGNENRYLDFAREARKAGFDIPICCADNSGDWFFIHQGTVKKTMAYVFQKEGEKEEKKL